MFVEVIMTLSVLICGVTIMRVIGIEGWILPAMGFVTGIAIHIIIGTIQAVTIVSSSPVITIMATILLSAIIWFWCYIQGKDISIKITPALIFTIFIVLAVLLFRTINLQCFTPDSFRYIEVGSLLESGNLNHATPNLLLDRLLAVPLMHAAANLVDEFYFRSITPLLAISSIFILAWLIHEGLSLSNIESWLVKLFSITGAFLLVTSNRFVFNAFYINGHMLTAVFLLLLVGCGWLQVKKATIDPRALLVLQVISISVLTLTRPENPLFAGIALLPFLASGRIFWKHRALLLFVLGFSVVTWYGFLWIKYIGSGEAVPISVVGMIGFGSVSVMIAPLLAWRKIDQLLPNSLVLAELSIWLILMFFAFQNFSLLKRSILATIDNIFLDYGGWGSVLVLLIIISIGVMIFTKVSDFIILRFPITTFLPYVFLLAYLRDGAYRVGHGDSLNRMFLHIVPLAILFIISTAASEEWGLPDRLKYIWYRLNVYTNRN